MSFSKIVEDSLHLFGDRVISSEGLQRLQYYQEFEKLYQKSFFYSNRIEYGRIYNLSEMAEYLVILSQAARTEDDSPYVVNGSNVNMDMLPKTRPLYNWDQDDWDNFRQCLSKIHMSMLRCDANASVDDDEDRTIDDDRSQKSKWFTNNLLSVLKLFTFHERFAPFREYLEDRIDCGNEENAFTFHDEESLQVTKEFMNRFLHAIKEEKETYIENAMNQFLQKDTNRTSFRSPSTIRAILNDKPFSFSYLLERVNKLMLNWAHEVFETPVLSKIYPSENDTSPPEAFGLESNHAKALRKLQRSRARLDGHVEDPLPDVVAMAERAKRKWSQQQHESDEGEESDCDYRKRKRNQHLPSGGTEKIQRCRLSGTRKSSPRARGKLLEKKKTATRLEFSQKEKNDGEYISDPEEVQEEDVLPEVKSRATSKSPVASRKKSQDKMYEGRRVWTDIEKNAIIEGIEDGLLGKWAEIKKREPSIFRNRTSGQIKVRHIILFLCYCDFGRKNECCSFQNSYSAFYM